MSEWKPDSEYSFRHPDDNGKKLEHTVYVKGDGPPILILQELPGIGSETFRLIKRLNAAGFSVHLPHLFGPFGKANKFTTATNLVRICIRREFHLFRTGSQSPIANWMRGLCHEINKQTNSSVGVIGMCLTGSFAIPLMAEDAVIAAVASQPSLPFYHYSSLHMSQNDVDKARAAMDTKGCAIAMRYKDDHICKPEHVCKLKEAFKDHLEVSQYTGNSHSLLTIDFNEVAYQKVESYFRSRMMPTTS